MRQNKKKRYLHSFKKKQPSSYINRQQNNFLVCYLRRTVQEIHYHTDLHTVKQIHYPISWQEKIKLDIGSYKQDNTYIYDKYTKLIIH